MNSKISIIMFGFLFALSLYGAFMLKAVDKESESVAIVCYVSGKAAITIPPDNKIIALQLFDRLKAGTEIKTESNSKVVIAFFTGAQYEIGEESTATVEPKELKSDKSSIKKLQAILAMPKIAPIAKEENPGKRAAAIRIRGYLEGQELLKPYPRNGAAVLADSTVLSIKPVEGIDKYKVDIEDENGNSIFSVETSSTAITISPNILKDGSVYLWRVRTINQQKRSVHAEEMFETVSKENAKLRLALKQQMEKQQDISLLMLLADVDHNLGLKKEACDELHIAMKQSADNPLLQQTLQHFECEEAAVSTTK